MLMRVILRSSRSGGLRKLLFILAGAVTVLGMIPDTGGAVIIPAEEASQGKDLRAENLEKIKSVLERKEVAKRLAHYGLTPEEVEARLDQLSDEQVSEIAARIDQVNPGGNGLEAIIGLVILAALVVLILYLLGYIEIPAKKKNKPAAE